MSELEGEIFTCIMCLNISGSVSENFLDGFISPLTASPQINAGSFSYQHCSSTLIFKIYL